MAVGLTRSERLAALRWVAEGVGHESATRSPPHAGSARAASPVTIAAASKPLPTCSVRMSGWMGILRSYARCCSSPSSSSRPDGPGLGLTIARELARALWGGTCPKAGRPASLRRTRKARPGNHLLTTSTSYTWHSACCCAVGTFALKTEDSEEDPTCFAAAGPIVSGPGWWTWVRDGRLTFLRATSIAARREAC
jgi:hypothetical protein